MAEVSDRGPDELVICILTLIDGSEVSDNNTERVVVVVG